MSDLPPLSRPGHANFEQTNSRSWRTHERYLCHFYRSISLHGQYTPIKIQQRRRGEPHTRAEMVSLGLQKCGVDVISLSPKTEQPLLWDEKADSHTPQNFCLEMYSNTTVSPWIPGWMATSQCDWLLYCFDAYLPQAADLFTLPFYELQRWFWPVHEHYPKYVVPDTCNHTLSRIVPIGDVLTNVLACRHYVITASGEVMQIPLFARASEYVKDGHLAKPNNVTPFIRQTRSKSG